MAGNIETRDTTYAVYMAGFIVLAWLFWHFFHKQVTELFRIFTYGEFWLLSRIVSDPAVPAVRDILHDPKHYDIDWPYIRYAARLAGHFLRWPIMIILVTMAYLLMVSAPKSSYRKAYSLDKLIAAQAKIWPVISPIIKFNPAVDNARDPNGETPTELPLFAEALSPEEWLKYNSIPHGPDGLDQVAVAQAFAEQLGPRWRGPDALPFHVKALFAVFALKAARQREEADKLLGELALCADPKSDMALRPTATLRKEIDRIVKDPKLGGEAAKVTANHAFVTTAMLRLLGYSRDRGGVLAPAQFLWLRGANRALWYPLNNLGRQSFHAEAAGAISHYMAERAAGTPLLSPKVTQAVMSLNEYDHRLSRSLPGLAE